MHAYPLWPQTRGVLTAAALAFTLVGASSAAAGEPTPAWLSAIGEFVRDGIEPPRTVEDLMRLEEKRQVAKPAPAPQPVPAPAPVAIAAPPPAEAVLFGPQPVETPEPPKAVEVVVPVRKAVPVVAVAPRPAVTPAELKPRPVERMASRNMPVPQPAAEPLAGNRIAATANLEQAMRLGGPAGLYAQRVKRPQIVQ